MKQSLPNNRELRWEQPGAFKQRYELRADKETVASLEWRSAWGSLATAESERGCWTFKRVGFWRSQVTVRQCGEGRDLATFDRNVWSGGGALSFPDGRTFRLTTNTWQNRLDVIDADDQRLLRYDRTGWLTLGATLSVNPQAAALDELPWLVMFGWYVIVMLQRDTAATVAASVA